MTYKSVYKELKISEQRSPSIDREHAFQSCSPCCVSKLNVQVLEITAAATLAVISLTDITINNGPVDVHGQEIHGQSGACPKAYAQATRSIFLPKTKRNLKSYSELEAQVQDSGKETSKILWSSGHQLLG